MAELKYEHAISALFEPLYEGWMTEEDREEARKLFLQKLGRTMEELDNEVAIGVQNGYSVETQLQLLHRILR